MSTPRRRAAFDPNALGDIDELLPPLPAPSTTTRPTPAPSNADGAHAGEVSTAVPVRAPRVPAAGTRRRATAIPARVAPPEVTLAPEVYAALRTLTLRERGANPATARTYGRVVLDAVEAHANELSQYWIATQEPTLHRRGLFSSPDPRPTRRRHSQAPARVPLAGVLGSDVEQLDALTHEWGAGSRSALVEQALRRYLLLGDNSQS